MNIYVFGAGGHSKVVISTLLVCGYKIEGIYDDDPTKQNKKILGISVIGTIKDALLNEKNKTGILAIGDNKTRKKLFQVLKNWKWVTVIHPKAYVDISVTIGEGTVVFAGSIIQADANIGLHVITNTGAIVEHDCIIGDFCHIAPGSKLGGGVQIREGALIGIGANILPGVKIGAWSIVGAGSVVIEDVPDNVIVAGVPAKIIKRL